MAQWFKTSVRYFNIRYDASAKIAAQLALFKE